VWYKDKAMQPVIMLGCSAAGFNKVNITGANVWQGFALIIDKGKE